MPFKAYHVTMWVLAFEIEVIRPYLGDEIIWYWAFALGDSVF